MKLELELRGPGGEPVDLARTLNSHGFAGLPPTRLDEVNGTLEVTLPVKGGRPRRVRIQPGRKRFVAIEVLGPAPGARVRSEVLAGARRVLRLDQDLSGFYALVGEDADLAWAATGAGRMLQSPTVFEDVVKTICTTNCSWALTTRMVHALVAELGEPAIGGDGPLTNAFPTPAAMAARPERFYREVVRAGYRAPYFLALARSVHAGDVDLESLADPSSNEMPEPEIESRLLGLPGVGPYAATHIMMTLGRTSKLILDSWTRPKYARLLGKRSVSDATIARRFRSYGDRAGLAFWLFLTRDWVE
ncbi:MAG: Fe-S cluster assembly protein HesB [Actinomycetota bacterium]|nr:Fe-S cluster assembly protein HesB [Actinomycetota bacterium]